MIYLKLTDDQKIAKASTPVLVWATKNPDDETREQVIENHERFRKLPFEAKYKLGFQYTPEVIKKIGEEFGMDPLKLASISRALRNFYFGDIKKRDISRFLGEEMEISLEQANRVANTIIKRIIEAPIPKEASEQVDNLPLLDAIAKYQRLSEQTVTEDRIVVKGESSPVRGSLRNWLRHYRDAVGIRKHSTMERGQFLFQGDNTKRLSAMERERVSFLLKSLDENTPVSIDTDRQEIIFPAFEERGNAASATTAERVVPTLETSFRPLEKFPAQAAPIRKALEWNREEVRGNVLSEKRSEVSQQKASTTEVAAPFGNIGQQPFPEAAKSRVVGVSAPVYTPASPPVASGAPIPQQGNMSFSSSHVLPHEKAIAEASAPSQDAPAQQSPPSSVPESPREPEAISVIRPRGNHSGFRGGAEKETVALPEGSSDAPRVVNLRSSGGRNARGRV